MTETVKSAWKKAAQDISSDTPELDAQILLAHVLDQSTTWLLTWPDNELTKAQEKTFFSHVHERQQGKPIAYIIGKQEFWSLPLKVTPATLIPRPDTECLIEEILAQYPGQPLDLLDAATGTGAIAIALAKERSMWNVVASDYSSDALSVTKINVENIGVGVELVHGDWLTPFPERSFDVIVSNPPYVNANDHHLESLAYEPRSALVAANHGLEDIEMLCQQAAVVLKPGGKLFVEHGYDQREKVREIFLQNGYRNILCKQDYAGNDRFTFGESHE